MIRAVITSIPKNVKESVACSENYRGIALSSILGKVFDLIIIQRYGHALSSSDLQFSFKERYSTVMCSAAIKEVTSHYLQKSYVYACMLDATKAFDKVSFTKLFALLLKRDIPAIILRVVLDLYTRQSVAASWNGCTSNPFSVTNGVRQGGVLSPILFNVYMDELIDKHKMNDVGCHIGRQFTGAFCYADDLTLLSPTIRGLQKMLNVCDDFANEYSVKFNARKTVCMCFSRKPTCRDTLVGYCHLAPKRRRRHLSSKTRKILALLQRQRHMINRLFNGPWRETSWGAAHWQTRGKGNNTIQWIWTLSGLSGENIQGFYYQIHYCTVSHQLVFPKLLNFLKPVRITLRTRPTAPGHCIGYSARKTGQQG